MTPSRSQQMQLLCLGICMANFGQRERDDSGICTGGDGHLIFMMQGEAPKNLHLSVSGHGNPGLLGPILKLSNYRPGLPGLVIRLNWGIRRKSL